MHDRWRLGLLAALVVLAGCGGTTGTSGPTTTLTYPAPSAWFW